MVDQQKKIIVTRFAPSPTGIFHLGSLRTALFNFLFARSLKGRFLLRIEDTDLQRSIPAEAERIEMFLKSFGLFFDSITFQKERFPIYLHYGNKLVASGLAYKSSSDKGRSVFFLNVNEFRKRFLLSEISFFDQLRKKEISFDLKHFGDFVIIKSDGSPGYNFSVVIDDYLAKVTDVLRGEEHIANMPKQLIIYRSFSFSPPRYFHLGLLVDAQKKKLSKRSADQTFSISKLMELGFLKEALLNFVAFLGWKPLSSIQEIFTLSELERTFSPEGLNFSPSTVDFGRLVWFNRAHLNRLSEDEFFRSFILWVKEKNISVFGHSFNGGKLRMKTIKWLRLLRKDIDFFAQLIDWAILFKEKIDSKFDGLVFSSTKAERELILRNRKFFLDCSARFELISSWTSKMISLVLQEQRKKWRAELIGSQGNSFFAFNLLRLKLIGSSSGPNLVSLIELLGKEYTLARMRDDNQFGLKKIKKEDV